MVPLRPALLLAGLGLVMALPSAAEEFDAGGFVVHYTVISTMDLAPQVAATYGIARNPHRALLNVSVVRKVAGTTGRPIPAMVQVLVVNQAGQARPIALRRVDEPPSVYYLGEVTVADRETLNFDLNVLAEGETSPLRLRLQQQFFTR
jgi:hypothetical protein